MAGRDPNQSDPTHALESVCPQDPHAEPWQDQRIFNRMMLSLLERLAEYGPMTDDQIVRHCLRPDELSVLVPEPQRSDYARNTCDAAVNFLDPDGDKAEYAIALEIWKQAIGRARYKLDWKSIPPHCHSLAQKRATLLLKQGQANQWIATPKADEDLPNDGNRLWQIAPLAFQGIEYLRKQVHQREDL